MFRSLSYLVMSAFAAGPALADVSLWKEVGPWDVSFYSAMPGCMAYANYEGGTGFFLGFAKIDRDLFLDLTVMDKTWQSIEDGKEYQVKLYFGDESPWTLEMSGVRTENMPALTIRFDALGDKANRFSEEFQRELYMEMYYKGVKLGKYTLRGSRAAFQETIRCQRSFNTALQGAASDPFSGSGSGNSDPFSR